MLSSDWLQNFQYNHTQPTHGRLLYIRKARLSTVLNLSKQVLFVCLDWRLPFWYRYRAGLNYNGIHTQKLKGVLPPSIVRHHHSWRKCRSSLNFARIEKCQKRRWHYFLILRGVCFLTFFDTSKTQRARPFPSFSREPHANQDHMAGPRMAISCS